MKKLKSNKFQKRIATLFPGYEFDRYQEDLKGNHAEKVGGKWVMYPSSWIEFYLVPPAGEVRHGITFRQLMALEELLGTCNMSINGWSPDEESHLIAICAYDVEFGK